MSTNKWYTECGAHLPNGYFTRNHMMPAEKVNAFRFKYKNKGVFTTAYLYDKESQAEANLYGDFYLDLDYDLESGDKEAAFNVIRQDVLNVCRYLKVIMNVEPNDVDIFFSGSKGIHIFVPKETLGVKPDKNLHRIFRMMAEEINKYTSGKTIDLKIYDNKRLLRMANSVHQKTGLYKIYLSYEEISTMTYEQIRAMASEPRAIPKKERKENPKAHMELMNYIKKFEVLVNRVRTNLPSNVKLEYTPPCVQYLFDNMTKSGSRNETVAFLSSYLKQSGISEDDAIERMFQWNESKCEPKLPDREIEITVGSIYHGDGKFGCSTARIISKGNCDDCKINRNKRR